MNRFNIEVSTREEVDKVDSGIVEYNRSKVPFTKKYEMINRVIRDDLGEVVAGINSVIYSWDCLYIDILWVNEEYRGQGCGSALITEVENLAKDRGCNLIHLDTFDFQAKDFYLQHGYEVFGILDDCPKDHKRYYLKKVI